LTYNYPDSTGHFGPYGGIFMAETLIPAVEELRQQYLHYRDDPEFKAEFAYELKHYVGRPSPISREKLVCSIGRCADLSEARRPQSHRRAQDQ
jgi:tryptophan synthase beta chain